MKLERILKLAIIAMMICVVGVLFATAVTITKRVGFLGQRKKSENAQEDVQKEVIFAGITNKKEKEQTEAEEDIAVHKVDTPDAPIVSGGKLVDHNEDGIRVWIGDSRMVGIERAVDYNPETDVFICEGAQCYTYFEDEAVPKLKELLDQHIVSEVYINMGLNDCANNSKGWTEYTVENYVNRINGLVLGYPEVYFYFISVGHTDGNYSGTVKIPPSMLNPYVDEFNETMKYLCAAEYIPCCEYLDGSGIRTADGVHFGSEANQMIFDYVLNYHSEE